MSEVKGNFEMALIVLLRDVDEGVLNKEEILDKWDKNRGNDWYTSTTKRDNKND